MKLILVTPLSHSHVASGRRHSQFLVSPWSLDKVEVAHSAEDMRFLPFSTDLVMVKSKH